MSGLYSILKGKQERLTSITYTLSKYIKSNPHDKAAVKALERYQNQLDQVNGGIRSIGENVFSV